jgi:hypothetical protein
MLRDEYSIRVWRHWNYETNPPSKIRIYDVWRGDRWISGHPHRVEAEAKIRLLRRSGHSAILKKSFRRRMLTTQDFDDIIREGEYVRCADINFEN